ncbi:transcriptional regulator [Mucilaginibacter terrenus]|uniref:Transcriptional regulator n=1 Tax=Mucilaginibacter terrenus TaxID=2482727 RepID=A0A3E2NMR7_9SPHI|nr:helix-turn-helix domain-containing protein [Mucilaginibacter terrenus]RFZ82296.1 transcriptional regulator [Mucilaginibacter terrenus]
MTKQRQTDYTCSMAAALAVISGKWKLKILNQLLTGPRRYSEINRNIDGMTEKMLSQQLRELEEDGIVARKVYPEVPPRVEYTFTDLGAELSDIFYALEKWGSHFLTAQTGTIIKEDASCYVNIKDAVDVINN